MSLYGDYISERLNRKILETEHGFISYVFCGDKENECYIVDLYVKPEFRRKREGTRLGDEVVKIAKEHGCTIISGSVDPTTNNPTASVKALLNYGFDVVAIANGLIWFKKEI